MTAFLLAVLATTPYDTVYDRGVEAYRTGEFSRAASEFQQLVHEGVQTPDVFFNLGNARFRLGDMPGAIVNYERALRLDPNHRETRENLAMAVGNTRRALGKAQPDDWEQHLFFWHHTLSPGQAFGLAFLFWLATWALLALRRVRAFPYQRRLAAVCGLLALLLLGSYAVKQRSSDLAVTAVERASARYGNDERDAVHFELFAGDRVSVEARSNGWTRVQTPDGKRGWVRDEQLVFVGPPYHDRGSGNARPG
jgi:tetratricopeptide (TPR) repeat protein